MANPARAVAMIRKGGRWSAIIALLAMTACIQRLRVELHNDSGRVITLKPADQQACRIEMGQSCAFWYFPNITLADSERRWDFEVAGLPGDVESQIKSVEQRGPFGRLLRLRLDAGRTAHVAQPGAPWSVELPTQPPGYPLRPLNVREPDAP